MMIIFLGWFSASLVIMIFEEGLMLIYDNVTTKLFGEFFNNWVEGSNYWKLKVWRKLMKHGHFEENVCRSI